MKRTGTYEELYQSLTIGANWESEVARICRRAIAVRRIYQQVGDPFGIPWWWIAAIHALESSQKFYTHLHNGDPLTHRTINVPAGRPSFGYPPFSWTESAADALKLKALHQWKDWSVDGCLYQAERYNGFGYRRRGLNSPYLWSGSQHYDKGKYVADGKFNPEAVSKQIGVAVIWKQLEANGEIEFYTLPKLPTAPSQSTLPIPPA